MTSPSPRTSKRNCSSLEHGSIQELWYDPEQALLEAWYSDELAAHRARKGWEQTLQDYFLLEKQADYELRCHSYFDEGLFGVLCRFHSACGRYALWRISNHQVPEAQGELETAHLPPGASREFGPDLTIRKSMEACMSSPMHAQESPAFLSTLLERMTERIYSLTDSLRACFEEPPTPAISDIENKSKPFDTTNREASSSEQETTR